MSQTSGCLNWAGSHHQYLDQFNTAQNDAAQKSSGSALERRTTRLDHVATVWTMESIVRVPRDHYADNGINRQRTT